MLYNIRFCLDTLKEFLYTISMKIYERIKTVREEMGLTIQDVYARGEAIFGKKKALSYRTLQRIEKGNIAKFASILRISCALGTPLEYLLKGTELEHRMVIRKSERLDEYTYNDKAQSSVISSPARSFLALEMTIKPGGKTPVENSPVEGHHEKWIYIVEGTLLCRLGEECFILGPRDSFSFESSIPHMFENKCQRTCVCVIVENPKHF